MTPFYSQFNGTIIEDFTIGSDDCDVDAIPADKYCNGPLRPGRLYKFKIRAFTTGEKFTDTVFSYTIATDPDNTALIFGITFPAILLVVIGIIYFVLRHKRMGPFSKPFRKDGLNSNGLRTDHETLSIAESEIMTSRPIKLKDFGDHYRIMSADSDFRFAEEFELLKHVGRDKPCAAADLPVNRPKNRFTNILPYDHSRVKLHTDDEEGSDYVSTISSRISHSV